MPQLKILLLGTPRVFIDDASILIKRRKAVALLAYLAVTGAQCGRESLATMLSPDKSEDRARGELRRALAALKEAGLDPWLKTNREFVHLHDDIWLDVAQFQQMVDKSNGDVLSAAIDLYQGDFMAGFTLRNSAEFDNWQALQTQILQQKLLNALEATVEASIESGEYESAIRAVQHWVAADEFNEYAQQQAMIAYAASGQRAAALSQYEAYADLLNREIAASPLPETNAIYENIKQNRVPTPARQKENILGNMPPLPPLLVGREDDFAELRKRIAASEPGMKNPVVVQGWPGIGKTTLSASLAHDSQLRGQFADGVLWISLGNLPDLMMGLRSWAGALGIADADDLNSIEGLSRRIAAFLKDKQMLLVIDDIWEAKDFAHFDVGGERCKTLATTRLNSIAESIVTASEAIYKIPVLTDRAALDLMHVIAPQVVEQHPDEVEKLVESMEGLPLAIQVAGRMLRAEMGMGWGVADLLAELSDGARLLEEQAPADRVDLIDGASPSVAILLKRSTDRLDDLSRERFALLGVFAPKPATFDLKAIAAVWGVDNPRPSVRELVDRGLMEPIGGGYFQIHALLVAHARAMVEG
jgi:DNA-binding SARP family transcriptional activator